VSVQINETGSKTYSTSILLVEPDQNNMVYQLPMINETLL